MRSTVKRVTTRESFYVYADLMDRRVDFKTGGALRGEACDGYFGMFGWMPLDFRQAINGNGFHTIDEADQDADLRHYIDYVVYSYQTPIALHYRRGDTSFWITPEVRYTQTTSCHQGHINTAASVSDTPERLSTVAELHHFAYKCHNDHTPQA